MSPRVKAGNGRDASGSQPVHTWATWLPKPEDSPPHRVTGAGAGSQRTQTLARDCPETVRTPPISITLSEEENSHFVIIKCIMHILKKCRIKAEMLSHKSKLLNPGHGPVGWGDSPVPNKTPSSPTPQATWASMTRDATSTDL